MMEPVPSPEGEWAIPATGRERAARGVMAREEVSIATTRPGAGLSIKGAMACKATLIRRRTEAGAAEKRERTSGVRS